MCLCDSGVFDSGDPLLCSLFERSFTGDGAWTMSSIDAVFQPFLPSPLWRTLQERASGFFVNTIYLLSTWRHHTWPGLPDLPLLYIVYCKWSNTGSSEGLGVWISDTKYIKSWSMFTKHQIKEWCAFHQNGKTCARITVGGLIHIILLQSYVNPISLSPSFPSSSSLLPSPSLSLPLPPSPSLSSSESWEILLPRWW